MQIVQNPLLRRMLCSKIGALALVAVALGGCAHPYHVKVEALRSPVPAPRQTYRLVSAVQGREEVDAHYGEVAAVVERALIARGLFAASRPEWADVVVTLDYGTSAIRLRAVADSSGAYAGATSVFFPNKDGSPLTEATGAYVPTSALERVVAVREKRLLVFARENTLGGNTGADAGAELWRVEVGVEDDSSSLTELLPVLAGALVDYIDATSAPACVERLSKETAEAILVAQDA